MVKLTLMSVIPNHVFVLICVLMVTVTTPAIASLVGLARDVKLQLMTVHVFVLIHIAVLMVTLAMPVIAIMDGLARGVKLQLMNSYRCVDSHLDYTCNCKPGWTGKRCETPTDECSPYPCVCANSYRCVDSHRDYTCNCKPGIRGAKLPLMTVLPTHVFVPIHITVSIVTLTMLYM